ncbi:hypothetical protein ACFL27_15220 [candidate division CSSED10-310 bacterium]|uniref:Uncharacterized protein n=1 Tax=candidate division CSSED10-310 bacterium TaxID=2855610 RepID=A0ABV6YZC3_UNCC1
MEKKIVFRPIWEMELIISGAIIIGLFQLPQLADQSFEAMMPHVSNQSFWLPFMAYYLAKLSINGLIGAFLLHFTVRSLWVAVLGLQEVFPGSVDLSKTDLGVIAKRFFESRRVDLDELRLKLDHFASLIFSVLFMMIIVLLMLAAYVAMAALLAAIIRKIGATIPFSTLFIGIGGTLYVSASAISVLGALLDKWLTKDETRLKQYPRLVSTTYTCHLIAYYMFFAFLISPIATALRSKVSAKGFIAWSFILAAMIIFPFMLSKKMKSRKYDSYIFMPVESAPQLLDTACYDNLRKPGDPVNVPSIQADIILAGKGPIRLFMPLFVLRNNQLMLELCPDLKPFHTEGSYKSSLMEDLPLEERVTNVKNALECTKKLFHITLDDDQINSDGFLFTHHHLTKKGGLLLYLSTAQLTAGQHTLNIKIKNRTRKGDEEEIFFIPFWFEP